MPKDAIEAIMEAVVLIEDGTDQNSVNRHMVNEFGLWNMGHLMWAGQYGAVKVRFKGGDRDWAGWPTLVGALEGIRRDIRAKARLGWSLRKIIEVYAPPKENSTEAYIAAVAKQTGLDPSQPVEV